MDSAAVNALLCPLCGLEFRDHLRAPNGSDRALACANGHSFDVAKQGYLNLLTGPGTKFVPDTAAMVEARDAFLTAGHYQPLADALATVVHQGLAETSGHATEATAASLTGNAPLIVDAGTGTGWYLEQILASLAANSSPAVSAVGMDISKFALRRAARRNPQAVNLVWDLWRALPLGAGTADVVLVVFAPRNASEFARILKPGGTLIVVTPLPHHLAEIAQETGMLGIQDDKEAALNDSLANFLEPRGSRALEQALQLTPSDVGNVALMGPAGHHLDPDKLAERLSRLDPLTAATAAFRISTFQKVVR